MSSKPLTKFPALAIGQRFIWRGQCYVKTSPLLGCAEDTGHSQMIPRSALVESMDVGAAATVAKTAANSAHTALEALQTAALAGVAALATEANAKTVARVRRELQAAYQQALKLLDGIR